MTKTQDPSLDPAMMRLALELARRSKPSPNPRVGAVITADGEVVGRGHHERQGLPHAEIVALEEAGDRARGAELYVTLEPCRHHGHTGPCVEAIIAAGISRVAVGMLDPDPRVNGEGIQALEEAGIHVSLGLLGQECEQLLGGYAIHRTSGRPLVMLKAAITMDGRIATLSGDSRWISCEESRRRAHAMRAEADGVVVGIETVLQDDPRLTVRHCDGDNPTRIVLDSRLRTPARAHMLSTAGETPVIIAYVEDPENRADELRRLPGVEVLACAATEEGRVSPLDLVRKLGQLGMLSVLVEGGGLVHGAFVAAGVADGVTLFVSPLVLGEGRPWLAMEGVESIADGPRLTDVFTTTCGTDLLIEARFSKP